MHDERETSPAPVPLDPRFAAVLVAIARKFSPVIERIGTDLVIFRKTGLIE